MEQLSDDVVKRAVVMAHVLDRPDIHSIMLSVKIMIFNSLALLR